MGLARPGPPRLVKKMPTLTQLVWAAVDNPGMNKKPKKRIRARSAFIPFRRRRPPVVRIRPPGGIAVQSGGRSIVAMTLARELADAVSARPEEQQQIIGAALDIGQWLADEGYPGQWDMVKPAAILRGLDFLPKEEQDRFLFSFVGLLGHGALSGQISRHSAKRSLEEISGLTETESVRAFARTTAAQLQPSVSS